MSKWEQDSAQEIADALHELEAALKEVDFRTKVLHRVLHSKAKEHADALGIDLMPLSGGTPKPPRPE